MNRSAGTLTGCDGKSKPWLDGLEGIYEVEENLKWLWAAFSIAWALHIGYLALLSGRTRKLERQLEDLRIQLSEQSSDQ